MLDFSSRLKKRCQRMQACRSQECRGRGHPQILADQLPKGGGGQIMSIKLQLAPPDFQNFLRPCECTLNLSSIQNKTNIFSWIPLSRDQIYAFQRLMHLHLFYNAVLQVLHEQLLQGLIIALSLSLVLYYLDLDST